MGNSIQAQLCSSSSESTDLMANPQFRQFIDQFSALMANTQKVSLNEARRMSTEFFSPPTLLREAVHKIQDMPIQGSDGHEIPVRLYFPNDSENLPVFIYYHRGGWVFSNIEEADPVCRKFANHLGCIVASVDYRLAPENKFPKPFNDAYDAYVWIANHAAQLGINKDQIIVGGESAGGNLAAAVALRARDEKGPSIALQLLIYPIINSTINPKTYADCADKYFITKEAMEFFWSMYLNPSDDKNNPYLSPDKAKNLSGLPPAFFITAEHDPLRLEAKSYAKQLQKAGNQAFVENFQGVIHGFFDLPVYSDAEVAQWLMILNTRLHSLLR